MPIYSKARYIGASPLHAREVGLSRNLQTINIIPKLHLVFNDYFYTVHAVEDQEPPVWLELITFQSFKCVYDDEYYVPNLDG